MVPGTNRTVIMNHGIQNSARTIAVLSRKYLESVYEAGEWMGAYRADPSGLKRKLIPVCVEECERPVLLAGVVSLDLFGIPHEVARQRLLVGIKAAVEGIAKPADPPPFPGRIGHVETRLAEVDLRNQEIDAQVESLRRVLLDRVRDLAERRLALEQVFLRRGSKSFADELLQVLSKSIYPEGLIGSCAAAYRAESRQLIIEYELPAPTVVPSATRYRYFRAIDLVRPQMRPKSQLRKIYSSLIGSIALRTIAESFDAAPVGLVREIIFNGYVPETDRLTGNQRRPRVISVYVGRDVFSAIDLDRVDSESCLTHLNAMVSPRPDELVPVPPVVDFNLTRPDFVATMAVAPRLAGRINLLSLDPFEFERLVQELFRNMGMRAWLARPDDGFDVISVNDDPIVGGICVIQVKRYSSMVVLEQLRALAGAMHDVHATRGILVTTSWVGVRGQDFATRNQIEIIDGHQLISLLREHLGIISSISLKRLPEGWDPRDIE